MNMWTEFAQHLRRMWQNTFFLYLKEETLNLKEFALAFPSRKIILNLVNFQLMKCKEGWHMICCFDLHRTSPSHLG
jgi:hypothetical protein